MNIGNNIKKMRKALNMEQSELAVKLNVSNKTVSSWECGRTEPKMDMIEAMSTIFGIKKSELLEDDFTPYERFENGAEFEKAWKDLGGGRHPIDLTEEEYSLIVELRACKDTESQKNRLLEYALKLGGQKK